MEYLAILISSSVTSTLGAREVLDPYQGGHGAVKRRGVEFISNPVQQEVLRMGGFLLP